MKLQIACAGCDAVLDEEMDGEPRLPCPHCGSKLRHATAEVEDSVTVRDGLRADAYRGTKKRVELRTEPDLTRRTGQWAERYRLIDRENDEYAEVIRDEEGNLLYKDREKLSQHQGHGSAKEQ